MLRGLREHIAREDARSITLEYLQQAGDNRENVQDITFPHKLGGRALEGVAFGFGHRGRSRHAKAVMDQMQNEYGIKGVAYALYEYYGDSADEVGYPSRAVLSASEPVPSLPLRMENTILLHGHRKSSKN